MDLILVVSLIIVLLFALIYFISVYATKASNRAPSAPPPPKAPAVKHFKVSPQTNSCDFPAFFGSNGPIHDGPYNILSVPDHEELH